MSDFVILTEAGGDVGFGHLMRCSAISCVSGADLYVQEFGDCPLTPHIQKQSWIYEPELLINTLESSTRVLVDSYRAPIEVYDFLSQNFNRLVVIDDYNRINYPAEILINPGVKLPDYRNQTATVVGGSEYIILRDEVISKSPKSKYDSMKNVLVTFGGADNLNMLEKIVPLLVEQHELVVTVVVGNEEKRERMANGYSCPDVNWLGRVSADTMADLMVNCDFTISAGGQTLHELAFLGVPTIGICTGDDQYFNIEGYKEAGFLCEVLDAREPDIETRLSKQIQRYDKQDIRRNAAMSGRSIVDGRGAVRIANLIMH